ncbi:glycosyltransferase [Clostridium botulinum]|nr:glycosyltransferase [Clostridium botulinum]
MAKISIIMPVYNSAEYLRESINSILDQTYIDWEFLIVNEFGSDDGSKEIIEEYRKVDDRIILIQNEERLGISASMNVAIDIATGEYIARMDADDISLSNRFKKQIEFMENNLDVGMCGVKVEIFGSNPFEWQLETDKNKLATNILFYSPSVHPTVMIRKCIIDKYNLRYNNNYKASEDYELFSRICSVTSVANIDEVLFKYRIMENNATFKNNDIGLVLYSEVMEKQLKKMGLNLDKEEIQLLSPHYSMKGAEGKEVLEKFVNLDLLLKKILVANEKCNLYSRKYLSNTLHKRYKEAYDSISWACKNYDNNKIDEFYNKSIFRHEYFYEGMDLVADNKPKVTVLMPTYNSEKYVADTVWSILDQTYQNFELLIVNEFASNDDTLRIIEMFNDPRIRIIQNNERLGLAESLNIGIKEAKGKYIARIDADDLCDVNRLKLQVEFLDKNDDYGVCGSWQHHFGIDTEYVHKVPITNDDLKAEFIYNCELCHSTLMLRKSFFIENNLFYDKDAAAEDYELWTRAIYKFKFANLPRILGEYRIGDDNITAKKMKVLSEESAEIAFKNIIQQLKITIPAEHKKYLTGWVNEFNEMLDKKTLKEALSTEKNILKNMWDSNKKLQVYNDESLLKVINRRWRYCTNTSQSENYREEILSIDELFYNKNLEKKEIIQYNNSVKQSIIKRCVKKVLKRFYIPIKHRILDKFEKQLWDLDGHLKDSTKDVKETVYDIEGHIKDEIQTFNNKFNEIFENQKRLEKNQMEILTCISKLREEHYVEIQESILKKMDECICKAEENILQTMDGRIWKAELNILEQRKEYKKVSDEFNPKNSKAKLILINTPGYESSNLGDCAIAMAEVSFLKKYFKQEVVDITGTFYRENESIIKEYINEQDLIFITGGGYLGTLWPYEEEIVRKIIKDYPNNSIVVFPQTIYYSNDENGIKELEKSKEIYNSHNKLLLCARDKISYDTMINSYKNNKIIIMPDMVLFMGAIESNYNRDGILLCLKNDKESNLNEDSRGKLKKIAEKYSEQVKITDTMIDKNVAKEIRKKYIDEKLKEFQKSELIITDRLHGMIFAAITGTRCIAIDNCNHKIKSTYEWIKELEYIQYADNLDNVQKFIESFETKKNYKYDNSMLVPYFEKLKGEIEQLL